MAGMCRPATSSSFPRLRPRCLTIDVATPACHIHAGHSMLSTLQGGEIMRTAFITVIGSAFALSVASAQAPARTLGVADYLDLQSVASPQISPDGKAVVYARGHIDRVNDREESEIWIIDPD